MGWADRKLKEIEKTTEDERLRNGQVASERRTNTV